MSADLRGILEAYSAVYDNDVKETLNSFHDEVTDMDLSLISERELSDIAEEALQELFEEGYSLFESEIILEDVIVEASSYMTAMMKGQNKYRKQQKRQEKIDRVKGAIKGALDTAKMKASTGAVKAYGAYRKAKQAADDKARRTSQTAKNVSAQTSRKASEAKAQVKSGLKGMIRKAAERVASGASKVAKRMTEGKDSSYLETDMKKRKENNEKARKEMAKVKGQKNPHFEEVSQIRKGWGDAYRSIYEKKLDPVGKEDGDVDNDGDEDSSDEYLMKRRKAIGKAMGKKKEKVEEGMKPYPAEKVARKREAVKKKEDIHVARGEYDQADKQYKRGVALAFKKKMKNEEFEDFDQMFDSLIEEGYTKSEALQIMTQIALDEDSRRTSNKQQTARVKANIKSFGSNYTPPSNYDPDANRGQGEVLTDKQMEKKRRKALRQEDYVNEAQAARNNPEKYEREARKTETSGQKAERRVRDRLKTMDPKRAEAMKKQMRAVGLDV